MSTHMGTHAHSSGCKACMHTQGSGCKACMPTQSSGCKACIRTKQCQHGTCMAEREVTARRVDSFFRRLLDSRHGPLLRATTVKQMQDQRRPSTRTLAHATKQTHTQTQTHTHTNRNKEAFEQAKTLVKALPSTSAAMIGSKDSMLGQKLSWIPCVLAKWVVGQLCTAGSTPRRACRVAAFKEVSLTCNSNRS